MRIPAIVASSRFILFFLTMIPGAEAQYFERFYGHNDQTTAVYFSGTPDNGYIILGNNVDSVLQTSGYYLIKADSSGIVQWEKSLVDAFNAYGYSIAGLQNGNIDILGTHSGIQFQLVAEIKELDQNGNFLDSALYPPFDGWGTAGVAMTKTGDSTVAVTLYNDGFISNNYYSVFSLDTDLSTRWNDFSGFDGSFTTSHGIAALPDSNVYALSFYDIYFYSPVAVFDATAIRKFSHNGFLLLDSVYEFNCITTGITATVDGGALICGMQDSAAAKNIVLVKLDNNGGLLWRRTYGSYAEVESNVVRESADGGTLTLATINDPVLPGQHDLLLMKTNANGDSLWSRTFGGILDEHGLHLETDDHSIVLQGSTTSFGDDHIYLVKTDTAGIIHSAYNASSNGRYFCEKDTAILFIQPHTSNGTQVQWSNGETTDTILVTQTGSYFALVTDSTLQTVQTSVLPVYFSRKAEVWIGLDTVSICEGTSIKDTAALEVTNIYQWYEDSVLLPGENQPEIFPGLPGLYTLVVSNYCDADTASTFVRTFYQNPDAPIITAPAIDFVCPGDSLKLSIEYDSLLAYQWYSTDFFHDYIITGETDTVYFASQAGQFFVSAVDTNHCSTVSSTYQVNFDNDQVFVSPAGPTHFCEDGEVELSVPAGSDYLWSRGDTTQSIIADSTGEYFVSFIDAFGCPKISDTLQINIFPNPSIYLGADTNLCSDSTVVLEADSGFSNYLWQDGSTAPEFIASSAGPFPDTSIFYLTVIDTNGCTAGDTINITFDICAGISENPNSGIRFMPNPLRFGQQLEVKITAGREIKLILTDITGKLVLKKSISDSAKISETARLNRGIYHLSYWLDNKSFSAGKLIIY